MRRAEGVVFALGALGEARQASTLAQGADAVAPSGQDLVRIALVPDIPDQPVMRGIEYVVDGDRQFDHAKTSAEMSTGFGHGVDHLHAQFFGQLRKQLVVQVAKARNIGNAVQQGRFERGIGHLSVPFIQTGIAETAVLSQAARPFCNETWRQEGDFQPAPGSQARSLSWRARNSAISELSLGLALSQVSRSPLAIGFSASPFSRSPQGMALARFASSAVSVHDR